MKKTISWVLALSLLMTLFIPAVHAADINYPATALQTSNSYHQQVINVGQEDGSDNYVACNSNLAQGDTGLFYFTVPRDGNYFFIAHFADINFTGQVAVYMRNFTDGGDTKMSSYNVDWSSPKAYRRISNDGQTSDDGVTNGVISLKADKLYGLGMRVESITAGGTLQLDKILVCSADIRVQGNTYIPSEYFTTAKEGYRNAHQKDCVDAEGVVTGAIVGNQYPSSVYTHVAGTLMSPVFGRGTSDADDFYLTYSLDVQNPGYYNVTSAFADISQKKNKEDLYISLDGAEEVTAALDCSGDSSYGTGYATTKMYLSAGKHTLKLRRQRDNSNTNQVGTIYHGGVALRELKPVAAMYAGSVADENVITAVQDGTLVATIDSGNTLEDGSTVNAFFAIYDNDKQMVAVASSSAALADGKVTLTIENFETEEGKTYTAKAFFWNDKFWGECLTLAQ